MKLPVGSGPVFRISHFAPFTDTTDGTCNVSEMELWTLPV
jgi:hypothetical protein